MKKLGIILGVLAVVALFSPAAQAMLVKVNDVVVFQDSYEDGTLGELPAADDPQIGTWVELPANTYSISDNDPKYGAQCLAQVGSGRTRLGSPSLGAVDGDTVAFEFAIKSNTEWPVLVLRDTFNEGEYPAGMGSLIFTGNEPYSWGGGGWSDAGAVFMQVESPYNVGNGMVWTNAHTVGEWNEIVATHVVGTRTLSVSVNGGAAHDFTLLNQGVYNAGTQYEYTAESLDFFHIRNGSNYTDAYWDAIPEPATLSLLALGGLALIRRKR